MVGPLKDTTLTPRVVSAAWSQLLIHTQEHLTSLEPFNLLAPLTLGHVGPGSSGATRTARLE